MSDIEAEAILNESLPITHVRDIPSDEYHLVQDSQDIHATLESIGRLDELSSTGCLFVRVVGGDYEAVYQCERSVPYLDVRVWRLL
jgi:hypothetical protein